MKKEHTPTPWRRRTYTSNAHVITKGDKDIAYTPDFSETGKADADFIVKSVNNHDRLVEALERTGNALQRVTLSARSDNTTLTELKQSLEVYQEAKQLLAELNTQSWA